MASDNETVQAILDRLFTTGDSNAHPVILPNSAMAAPPRRRVEITDFYPTSGTGIELTVLGRTALEFEDARFDAEMRADNLEMEKLGLQCNIDKLSEQIRDKEKKLTLLEEELNLQVKKDMWLAKERERLQDEQDRVWEMFAELQAQNAVLKRKLEVSKGHEKSLKKQVKYLVKNLKESLALSKEIVE